MIVDTLVVGDIGANCYVIYEEGAKGAILIDPGADGEYILNHAVGKGLKIEAVFLTHGHFDHVLALPYIKEKTLAPVMIHENDAVYLTDPRMSMIPPEILARIAKPDRILKNGDSAVFAGLTIKVLHTPGHTPGSCCYIIGGHMFTGDTLFAGGIGRTDLPGSNDQEMRRSLSLLNSLDKDYIIMPGHGQSSTLFREKGFLDVLGD